MTSGPSSGARRIAVNTTLLYARMSVVMAVNLYTVRLVLNALGVVDYGMYDVVAGLVLLMSSVSNVLATATQRFYAVAIGSHDADRLREVFSASVVLYAVLALLVLLLAETAGVRFVNHGLVIPPERLRAANIAYQLSVGTFLLGIVHLPFSSAVITHEHLGTFAVISVGESGLKLLAAFLIPVMPAEPVLVHATALLLVAMLVAVAFVQLARRRYAMCRFRRPTDRGLLAGLVGFSGWSLFGAVAGVGLVQGISILVNLFFGPAVSAARAISLQLGNAVTIFTGSLITAVRPSMIRSYSEGAFASLNRLFTLSNKFIFFGLTVICLPLFVEMEAILRLWLGAVDAQTVLFSRLIVVYAVIMALNNPISVVIQATGRVREYHLLVEPFTLLCVPITYGLFAAGQPAYTTYVAMIVAAVLAHAARLWSLARHYPAFDRRGYVLGFLLPAMSVLALVSGALVGLRASVADGLWRVVLQCAVSLALTGVLAYGVGTTPEERALLRSLRAGRGGD